MFTKRLGQMKTVARPQSLNLLQQLGCFNYSTKKQQQQEVQQQQQQQQQELQPQQQQQQQQQESKKELLGKGDEDGKEKGGATMSEVEWLTQELAAVRVEHGDLLEKYKRALADGENMRKRLNKQIDDAKLFGIQGFCKDLIEVADVLGHATQSVPKDKLQENADLRNLYEGLNLTRASLLQVFKRHGLEALDPIQQKFDPNLHEALFQTEDDSVEANTVVQVTKLGYKLHKRCIRPALVGVSKR